MSGRLIVLVGLARSGKTTYCKKFDFYAKTVVVNSDQIRLALHGQRYNRLAEPLVHSVTKIMARSLYNQGYIVIIDETNTTVGSIKQWLEIDPDAEFIYIDTSPEECERRALACGQDDLVEKGVIRRMYDNLLKLCNYTIDKRISSGDIAASVRIQRVNQDDILMSIEDIREEVKNA